MPLEVFFNRPTKPIPLYRLLSDMASARNRLVLASAWFTDRQIAQTFVDSPAKVKLALLSKSDLARDKNGGAVQIIKDSRVPLAVLGTTDWREGTMHHKFVVADDVVWLGSYNFTAQAQKNYENIVRVDEKECANQFADEAIRIVGYAERQAPTLAPPAKVPYPRYSPPQPASITSWSSECEKCGTRLADGDVIMVGYHFSGDWARCRNCVEEYFRPCDTCGLIRGNWDGDDYVVLYGDNVCECRHDGPAGPDDQGFSCCICSETQFGGDYVEVGDSFGSIMCKRCHEIEVLGHLPR
jgi:hypothetical protein